ncbi:MAG: helix-turn-helix domain-containing protein [Deltaproteobacteria bacterium]|nr:helix-turn-helix domain-containing protein [Deltaproteobacteria bacterium]
MKEPTLTLVPAAPGVELPARRDLVGELELASHLGVSRSTLQSWRYSGRGPRFIKIGRLVRYRNADVESFLAACVQEQRG